MPDGRAGGEAAYQGLQQRHIALHAGGCALVPRHVHEQHRGPLLHRCRRRILPELNRKLRDLNADALFCTASQPLGGQLLPGMRSRVWLSG